MAGNKLICDKYGFVHLPQEKNTGICGGRQFAAEHFDKGEDDFYLFFEDDINLIIALIASGITIKGNLLSLDTKQEYGAIFFAAKIISGA